MNTKLDIPAIRTRERQNLIQTLAAHLQLNDRVKAEWLSGSIARGEDQLAK
jgi:predicted nucleotidyltransferase